MVLSTEFLTEMSHHRHNTAQLTLLVTEEIIIYLIGPMKNKEVNTKTMAVLPPSIRQYIETRKYVPSAVIWLTVSILRWWLTISVIALP